MEAKLVLEERNELLGVIGALSSRLGTSELFVVDDETVATRKAGNGVFTKLVSKRITGFSGFHSDIENGKNGQVFSFKKTNKLH